MLAENPTLKAAIDTYQAELGRPTPAAARDAGDDRPRAREAGRAHQPDVLAVTDPSGVVLAVAGPRSADWPVQRSCDRARTAPAPTTSRCRRASSVRGAPLSLQETEDRLAPAGHRARRPLRAASSRSSRARDADHVGRRGRRDDAADDAAPGLTPPVLRSLPANDDHARRRNTRSSSCFRRRRGSLHARLDRRIDARPDGERPFAR